METKNDSTIDQLARTICNCIQHRVPDAAIHDHVEEIIKIAEARAENFLHEKTGDWPQPEEPAMNETVMSADELIAEVRRHRIDTVYVDPREALHLVLTALLDTFDYEKQKAEVPAQFARMIASVIASIDDNPKRLS